ncbi:thioredoxin reductase 2, putative [Ichthyophthirius multifiliis]|uniref:Thioredoxin reductase 2, putative n=1 Tax=Ichthyophthirius multifiliis TaxID=5932 RepID=G0QWR7_ICHMU|nr:thioredoxin reductase 2, putative [Ichthyophthirius multifiliis]EGR30338.1 thioredoxin reductase 2, putative [Ichthyophthirius multifiliis]|eukprot:XP_004031925.1 thioredoxin reductase 2, putative [Ichthyophthirius multifiliis]
MFCKLKKITNYKVNQKYKLNYKFSYQASYQQQPLQNYQENSFNQNSQNQNTNNKNENQENINNETKYDYDVAIIGGGSAGLAFAFEAQKLGLKTIIFDYVVPSKQGTQWGIGGTCVNVGCIPKRLFHTASVIKDNILKANDFGFFDDQNFQNNPQAISFSWERLISNIQSYISDLNYKFLFQLNSKEITYINALATLKDKNTILHTQDKNQLKKCIKNQNFEEIKDNKITAQYIVICVGGRPKSLKINKKQEKIQQMITSDDLFSLQKKPGKTLIVGGGYIAMECGGFLSNLGIQTTVLTRNGWLKDFDREMVQAIIENMKEVKKVNFIDKSIIQSIQKIENNEEKINVCYKNLNDNKITCDQFDLILQAIGRKPNSKYLNLNNLGVQTSQNKKILSGNFNNYEQTSIQNIFAVGDILEGVPELTSTAQMSSRLLAHRIYGYKNNLGEDQMKNYKMNYKNTPTTLFTPLEYSFVGIHEEQAIQEYGIDNIEVYHQRFLPLEDQLTISQYNQQQKSFIKIICDKSNNDKVLGIHYLGLNAGEILQGYVVAFNQNLFKKQLNQTITIHPTSAEEILSTNISKSSGENFDKDMC